MNFPSEKKKPPRDLNSVELKLPDSKPSPEHKTEKAKIDTFSPLRESQVPSRNGVDSTENQINSCFSEHKSKSSSKEHQSNHSSTEHQSKSSSTEHRTKSACPVCSVQVPTTNLSQHLREWGFPELMSKHLAFKF